jgi:hypothetical protein
VDPDGTAFFGLRPSIAVSPDNRAHFVVRNTYSIKDGASWRTETYDPAGTCPTIALDAGQNPHIAYRAYDADIGAYVLKLAVRGAGGVWTRSTVSVISQPAAYIAIAIDAVGATHLSYCDGRIVYLRKP